MNDSINLVIKDLSSNQNVEEHQTEINCKIKFTNKVRKRLLGQTMCPCCEKMFDVIEVDTEEIRTCPQSNRPQNQCTCFGSLTFGGHKISYTLLVSEKED